MKSRSTDGDAIGYNHCMNVSDNCGIETQDMRSKRIVYQLSAQSSNLDLVTR